MYIRKDVKSGIGEETNDLFRTVGITHLDTYSGGFVADGLLRDVFSEEDYRKISQEMVNTGFYKEIVDGRIYWAKEVLTIEEKKRKYDLNYTTGIQLKFPFEYYPSHPEEKLEDLVEIDIDNSDKQLLIPFEYDISDELNELPVLPEEVIPAESFRL
ncbi:MAG: hypothetical protein Q8Q35_04475 [Nanoarchaeota archaeon]|nr:hypothetical protein [Nanoarchaeota archaeon]